MSKINASFAEDMVEALRHGYFQKATGCLLVGCALFAATVAMVTHCSSEDDASKIEPTEVPCTPEKAAMPRTEKLVFNA